MLTAEELVNTRTHIERSFNIDESTTPSITSRKWKAKVTCEPEKRRCCTHTNDEVGDEDNESCGSSANIGDFSDDGVCKHKPSF